MNIEDHTTEVLQEELRRRENLADFEATWGRSHAVADVLDAAAMALRAGVSPGKPVSAPQLQAAAEMAYKLAWQTLPGGQGRDEAMGQEPGGMCAGWESIGLGAEPWLGADRDEYNAFNERRDALLERVKPGHIASQRWH